MRSLKGSKGGGLKGGGGDGVRIVFCQDADVFVSVFAHLMLTQRSFDDDVS